MQAKRTFKLVGVLALLVRKEYPVFLLFSWDGTLEIGRLPKSAAMDVATAHWQAVRKTCLLSNEMFDGRKVLNLLYVTWLVFINFV